jgi:hypothetical protein
MNFLKNNWESLSQKQKDTIIKYDADNKIKNYTLTTRRTIITLLIHLVYKFPKRPYKLITVSDYKNFIINKKRMSLNTAKACLRLFYKWLRKRKLIEAEEDFFKASKCETNEKQKTKFYSDLL